jgi:uncharacterized protein YciI
MKYFNIEATFTKNLSIGENEFKKASADHLAYLQKGFDEGFILLSGPKANFEGGFIIIKGQSWEEIENYIAGDPLKILDIQTYKITEFKLHDCQPMLKGWFD